MKTLRKMSGLFLVIFALIFQKTRQNDKSPKFLDGQACYVQVQTWGDKDAKNDQMKLHRWINAFQWLLCYGLPQPFIQNQERCESFPSWSRGFAGWIIILNSNLYDAGSIELYRTVLYSLYVLGPTIISKYVLWCNLYDFKHVYTCLNLHD